MTPEQPSLNNKSAEEEFTPLNPRVNPEKIKLETIIGLEGKFARLILNGDKFTPDGRMYPMIALINVVKEPEITVITRSSMGSVTRYTGKKLEWLLGHLYSIEETIPTQDMKFPEIKED